MSGVRTVRVFVSSPSDVKAERQRIEVVAERLNALHSGTVRIEVIRWETRFYTADKSFQPQIPEAAECDIVIGIFWARLGTELPPDFPRMPDGAPYPSGSAYEILSAIQKKAPAEPATPAEEAQTEVYVFQKTAPPFPAPENENDLALLSSQWQLVKSFFERWFRNRDGTFVAAFHVFVTTDQFEEQVDKLLRQWLAENVLKTRALVWPIATKGSPFRGLEPFDAWHASVFFGRSSDIVRATDRLKSAARGQSPDASVPEAASGTAGDNTAAERRHSPFLLVVGASGTGKSSLVRAGIAPRLITPGFVGEVDRWRVATLRPGDHATPLDSLAKALFMRAGEALEGGASHTALPELAQGDYATPELLAELWHGGGLTAQPIIRALDRIAEVEQKAGKFERAVRVDLVLVIDQLDELFVSDGADDNRARFVTLLANLAATGRVWLVASLRAALYERYLAESAFRPLRTGGVMYELASPGSVELAEIVRKPAEAAGLVFETNSNGISLDQQLLTDASDPDTLPVLQFTLQGLFERRQQAGDEIHLTFEAYDALGGIDGAIDKAAEAALEGLSEAEKNALPRLLRQLVVSVGSSTIVSGRSAMAIRSMPLASVASTKEMTNLVKALVEARILTSESLDGVATIRFAHQRALESWRRAQELLKANADFYRIRGEIELQCQRWESRGRRSDLLLPAGLPLAEAESVVSRFGDEIAPELQNYVARSGHRARLRQRATAAAAVAFACVAIAAIYYQNQAQKGLIAATDAVTALVQGISEVVRPLAQLDTVEELVSQARASIDKFGGAWRTDSIRKQQARTYLLIAEIDWDRGDIGQMRKDAGNALALLQNLNAGDPESMLLRANSHRFIGISYFENNERENARIHYEQGVADLASIQDQKLTAPLDWQVQRSLANVYQELGDVLLFKYYQPQDANGVFDKCLELRQHLIDAGHREPAFMHDLAWAENKHGDVEVRLGDDTGALAQFTQARDGLMAMGDHLWDNLTWAYDLSLIHNNLGLIALRRGQFDDALTSFTQAEFIIQRVVDYDPKNLGHRSGLSWTMFNRAEALFRLALSKKDEADLRQARNAFAASTLETEAAAAKAPLEARIQLGLVRGRAYIPAIDGIQMEWNGDSLSAAKNFAEAARIFVEEYLPHLNDYPRRDSLSEGIDYLDWAANAYVAAGLSDRAGPLLDQALDLVNRYQSLLGDGSSKTLRARIEGDISKARGPH